VRHLLAALLLCSSAALADYPERPVTIVVPYPPGGATDIIARYVAQQSGWKVVIENRPGATGMIGAAAVSRARPDGYTLLMGNTAPNGIHPGWLLRPPELTDWKLEPVAMVAVAPYLLAAPAGSTFTARELIAELNKGRAYASDGEASLAHLLMSTMAPGGIHVPYRGGSESTRAVAAGEVAGGFVPGPVALPWARRGALVVLAQAAHVRIYRDVPTLRELGVGAGSPLWWGIFAPPGTPRELLKLWNARVNGLLEQPAVRAWAEGQGYAPMPMTRSDFARFVARERRLYDEILARLQFSQR
jgi:tripartite-type tricarboxylate transporter receptor subunit TctC